MASTVEVVEEEWIVLYHQPGKFKGRGEFLRLMLEDAQIPYKNSGDDLYGPTGIMDAFRGSPDAVQTDEKDISFPVFFPPAILHKNGKEEVLINQVGACMIYLGDCLGYAPETTIEKARANSILLNALDYISEGRSSFHPIDNKMSYNDQKEQGDKKSKEFSQGRMIVYLYHFNKVIKKNINPKTPIAGGTNITYADFALLHVLDATVHQFNTEFYNNVWDNMNTISELKEYYLWMKSRPNLIKYFVSDRCAPFAGDSMM